EGAEPNNRARGEEISGVAGLEHRLGLRIHGDRNPNVRGISDLRAGETCGGDPDYRVSVRVQTHHFSDDTRIEAEATLPQSIADYRYQISARSFVLFRL